MKSKVYQELAQLVSAVRGCEKSGNKEWLDKHTEKIERIVKDQMPSGSGFDNGTTLDIAASTADKLVFNTGFHHMNEDGFYTEWSHHLVTVVPSLAFEFYVKVGGRNVRDIKDYITEDFGNCLSQEVSEPVTA